MSGNGNRNVPNLNNNGKSRVNKNGKTIFRNANGLYTRGNNGSRVNRVNAPAELSEEQEAALASAIEGVPNGLEREAEEVASLTNGILPTEAATAAALLSPLAAAIALKLPKEEVEQLRNTLNDTLKGVQKANAQTYHAGPSHWNGARGHNGLLLTEASTNAEAAGNQVLAATKRFEANSTPANAGKVVSAAAAAAGSK